jgi:hypothetical protein
MEQQHNKNMVRLLSNFLQRTKQAKAVVHMMEKVWSGSETTASNLHSSKSRRLVINAISVGMVPFRPALSFGMNSVNGTAR